MLRHFSEIGFYPTLFFLVLSICTQINVYPAAASTNSPNTELHVIDVYEGIPHESGVINVYITKRQTPLILYLGAYQPVRWNLIVEPSVQIERIILSGYHPQTITGSPPEVPILTLPYRSGYSSSGISTPTSLQGGYKGSTFYIGGRPSHEGLESPAVNGAATRRLERQQLTVTDLPYASLMIMPYPVSQGEGPITSESIDRYKTIAVLKFSDNTKTAGAGSIAAGLVTHLLATAGFSPVERVELSRVLSEQQLQLRHGDEENMAVNVGHITGARAVAVGEIYEWGYTRAQSDGSRVVELPTVSLSMRIIDAEKGTILFSGHGQYISAPHKNLDGTAKELLKALVTRFELKAGLVSTGILGFSWNRQMRSGETVFVVTEFGRQSAAYEAGLRSGDILLGCNQSSSQTWASEWHAKRACQAGVNQTATLHVRRGEDLLTISVRAKNRFLKDNHQ